MKSFVCIAALLCIASLSACSTIIEGRSQQITVNTNPPGASCNVLRQDVSIGTINPTPGTLYIEKTKYDINIKCDKPGYQTATYLNHSGVAGATFGNIVAGGLIGWGIDSASGADNKYESPVNVSMVPNQTAQLSPARHKKHHRKSEDDEDGEAADAGK